MANFRTMAFSELKGHGFLAAFLAVERMSNRETFEKVMALSPRTKALHDKKEIMSSGWYPIDIYAEFHSALRTVLGPGAAVRVGRETTIADVNSIFRFVLHLFSPESLAKFAPRVFRTYCRGPEAVMESSTPNSMQAHFFNFSGATQGIYEEFMSGTATFVELGGGKNCRFEVIDGGKDGDTSVRFKLLWD